MPLTDSTDNPIKDIPDIPSEIFKAASRGKLVVFIGAGVSRIIGCPSWKEFALRHLKYIYENENKIINYYEYKNLAELEARQLLSIPRKILEEKSIPPPDINTLLKGDEKLNEKYEIYKSLYSFHSIYVTTNYDEHLDFVAIKNNQPPLSSIASPDSSQTDELYAAPKNKVIYIKDDFLVSSLTNGTILHLHGSIREPCNMIVTIVDYMKHYENDSKPAVVLKEIFNSYTVIFIGYGLEEYEILEFMINKSLLRRNVLQHFMLYPIFKEEVNIYRFKEKYYADLGVQLLPYPIGENGYEHLATVVKEWAKQIGPIARPQNFFERIKIIDEVI